MVHSLRQVKAVSSHNHASEGLGPNATATSSSDPVASPPKSSIQRSILEYTKSRTSLSNSTACSQNAFAAVNSGLVDAASLPVDAGRPPSRLLESSTGALQEHINGIATEVEVSKDDVPVLAKTSAANFEQAIGKDAAPAVSNKDKRILRSQDNSSRPKSSLARFFPDFEEVVFGNPPEPELLTATSVLFVFDTTTKGSDTSSVTSDVGTSFSNKGSVNQVQDAAARHNSTAAAADGNPETSSNATTMDFTPFEDQANAYTSDPLADTVFIQAHKRGERKEKQIRNIEKEHALHEKQDLERLVEELRGPDWLRTMGAVATTDADRKKYEGFRDQYLQRAKALLHKFTLWKDQERELRLRREEALQAKGNVGEVEEEGVAAESHTNTIEAVDPSARQLQLEAKSALNPSPAKPRISLKLYMPLPEPDPLEPFVSFYANPSLRVAALSGPRRGRVITAFGYPIPDVEEQVFDLPEGYVTEEMVIANARKRRRMKRESAANSASIKK